MKSNAKRNAGFFASLENTFARFDNSGMHVDLDSFLATPEGKQRFRTVAKSAFRKRAPASPNNGKLKPR